QALARVVDLCSPAPGRTRAKRIRIRPWPIAISDEIVCAVELLSFVRNPTMFGETALMQSFLLRKFRSRRSLEWGCAVKSLQLQGHSESSGCSFDSVAERVGSAGAAGCAAAASAHAGGSRTHVPGWQNHGQGISAIPEATS